MGSTQRTDDPESTSGVLDTISQAQATVTEPVLDALEPVFDALEPVYGPIRDSLLLRIATMGVAFIAFGAILDGMTMNGGEGELLGLWAAIFAVWGSGLVLVGLVLYGLIWWRRR